MKAIINADGVRLKEALEEANLTQLDLVKMTGYPQSTVSRIATGRYRATSKEKMKIALALGKKVEEIFS